MVLIDKDIKKFVSENKLIVKGFNLENLGAVSYDLTVDYVCPEKNESYELKPGEVVFVKSQEEIYIPHNLLGRPAEKNSRMRQGLKVDAPLYHPGHRTFVFMRVQNISGNIIKIQKGDKIIQLFFEQLTQEPEIPYDENPKASFNNETEYIGLGSYNDEYKNQIVKVTKDAKKKIEKITDKIYPNIIALMGVLVSVFSIITINYNAFSQMHLDLKFIIAMNLTLVFCISTLLGLIFIFINKEKPKWFTIFYAIFLIVLAVIIGAMFFAIK